jgi:hypothetical protein
MPEENLFGTKHYNLGRRMKRIIEGLKNSAVKTAKRHIQQSFLLFLMVKVLTLNTQGIKGEAKHIHLALYAKRQRADILLLQEIKL